MRDVAAELGQRGRFPNALPGYLERWETPPREKMRCRLRGSKRPGWDCRAAAVTETPEMLCRLRGGNARPAVCQSSAKEPLRVILQTI